MTVKTKQIVNKQIQAEFYSAYLYLALAARLESWNLKGMANWMHIQAKEEVDHALGFFRFLGERQEEPVLELIAKPEVSSLKDPLAVFAAGQKHEAYVTGLINKIYETAKTEKDHALESFIKWYVDEQVEEEANAAENVDTLKRIGKEGAALYMLDKEMAARAYVPSGPYAAKA
ncbi:MAG: ferritin [Patescibacteria group bacterium]